MTRILLVDDDVELVGLLREYLETEGLTVGVAYDGARGRTLVRFDRSTDVHMSSIRAVNQTHSGLYVEIRLPVGQA